MNFQNMKEIAVCPPISLNIGEFENPCGIEGIPFNWEKSFIIETSQSTYPLAVDLAQKIILQVFLQCKYINCVVFQHASPYFLDVLEAVSNEKYIGGITIFRESNLIENHINELYQLIRHRDRLLARYQYRDWNEYLSNQALNSNDDYKILYISDIYKHFNPRNLNTLLYVMRDGPRLGIIVLGINSNRSDNFFGMNKIILRKEAQFTFLNVKINKGENMDIFLNSKNILFVPLSEEDKKYSYLYLIDKLKIYKSISFLDVEIGTELYDVNTPFYFQLGKLLDIKNNQIEKHTNGALIGGKTGSGKTTLINRIILSACEKYTPDEIQFFILDCKSGSDFTHFNTMPHCPIVFGNVSKSEIFSKILNIFVDERSRRLEIMQEKGKAQYDEYVKEAKSHQDWIQLPRWILFIDEAHTFLSKASNVNEQLLNGFSTIIRDLALTGRSYGLHVILSTQSFQNLSGLKEDVEGQFGLRIAMLCTKEDCNGLFGIRKANHEAEKLKPMQGVYNDDDFSPNTNKLFKINQFEIGEILARLEDVKKKLIEVKGSEDNIANRYTNDIINKYFVSEE